MSHFVKETEYNGRKIKLLGMKKILFLVLVITTISASSQTLLTIANDFHVKTIEGTPIFLYPILDEDNMIVVIDFFSTTCGPCQDFADDFQRSYEDFGENSGNVYFMGINWGNDNHGVYEFDSIFGLTYPTISGTQGGGNIAFNDYQIQAYPTVIVIKPDHEISNQFIWEPSTENINEAVLAAGGLLASGIEISEKRNNLMIFPNPANISTTINLSLNYPDNIYLDVVNSNGQIVFQKVEHLNSGSNSINLNVSEYKSGIYLVRMISEEGRIYSSKLVVSR